VREPKKTVRAPIVESIAAAVTPQASKRQRRQLCPYSGKWPGMGQGSMKVVDAQRSRWCVVTGLARSLCLLLVARRPNHDAPRTHEASILIPSISSFPLRLPLSQPALDLNLSLIQPYRDFYSDSIATRVSIAPLSISCLQIFFPQILGFWWTSFPLFLPPHQRRSVIQYQLCLTPNRQRLLLQHNNFTATDSCWDWGTTAVNRNASSPYFRGSCSIVSGRWKPHD
jgi:hypothetical protein